MPTLKEMVWKDEKGKETHFDIGASAEERKNWNKKVDPDGDVSETTVSNLEETQASFPQPVVGDKQETLWGKLKKWQQDCIAKFGNYVLTSMVTNQHLNSTSNIPTSALVYLMQQAIQQNQSAINVLNTNLKVEVGQAVAWGATINEQLCTRYGKHCDVYVRGTTAPKAITVNESLFSLPWKIKDVQLLDLECAMVIWNEDFDTAAPGAVQYEGQYGVIRVTRNSIGAKDFSFHFAYECE